MVRPRFSIVLPTRNRPHLLRFALQSALAQRHPDFEVVVSDNDSEPETRAVVDAMGDPRIRYFRTERLLAMPDSWEAALERAQGEHITFLSDDDAVSPRLLAAVDEALAATRADIVAWAFAGAYYHRTCDEPDRRDTLYATPVRRGRREVSTACVREKLLRAEFTHELPRLINSCAQRSLFDEMRARTGRVFWPMAPDYAVGTAQLELRSSLVFVEDVLLLWGIGKESIGHSQTRRGEAGRVFVRELESTGSHRFEFVPLACPAAMNYGIDTFLRVLHRYGHPSPERGLDRVAYYRAVGGEILQSAEAGADVGGDLEALRGALRREPPRIRFPVAWDLGLYPGAQAVRDLRSWLRRTPLATVARWIRRAPPPEVQAREFRGSEWGFANIAECAAVLDRLGLVESEGATGPP
jgi:glycosyltransferase involved in cell wall biosynthesis